MKRSWLYILYTLSQVPMGKMKGPKFEGEVCTILQVHAEGGITASSPPGWMLVTAKSGFSREVCARNFFFLSPMKKF